MRCLCPDCMTHNPSVNFITARFDTTVIISKKNVKIVKKCLISDFRREVHENCALLVYYAASSGKFLLTSWDNFHIHVQSVSGLMHYILFNIDVPFWHHHFISHLSCTALCFVTHILALTATCFSVLLTTSSGSPSPTAFPSQYMKYLLPLVSCLFKTVVFSQTHNILSEEKQCSEGQLVDKMLV